jgi:hypothetical protein
MHQQISFAQFYGLKHKMLQGNVDLIFTDAAKEKDLIFLDGEGNRPFGEKLLCFVQQGLPNYIKI